MDSKPYTVEVFGKSVEISSAAVSGDSTLSRPARVYRAQYTGTSQSVPRSRQVQGYGLCAAEAVLDMLKASRVCRGGTEML